jgi:hypothetical protein
MNKIDQTDQIRILIDSSIKKKFKTKCYKNCMDMSKLIKKWIMEYIEEDEEEKS